MNTRLIKLAALLAIALIGVVITAYVSRFGASWAASQDKWGQFGDYFGGTLNPLFAMLAFLALLWSIALQASEFKHATEHLAEQTQLAREEAEFTRRDKLSIELLEVIKDIDAGIGAIMATDITEPGKKPALTISHMASEAERLSNSSDSSGAYKKFLEQAKISGTLVESSTRELLHLVDKMRRFITDYSEAR